jgi:hypothetical protein
MRSTAQHVATVSIEVFVVQSATNGFLHKTVHIARHLVQDDGAAEVGAMRCIDTVLCHHRLIWLFDTYVSPVIFASSLDGSCCLTHIYLATFTWNSVHARDIQT